MDLEKQAKIDEKAKRRKAKEKKKEIIAAIKNFLIFCLKVGFFIVGFFIVIFFVIFLQQNGHTARDKNNGVCYGQFQFGRQVSFSFNVSQMKDQIIGKYIENGIYNSSGQSIINWVNSNLVTNGDIVELYASGNWYPWGREGTDKRNSITVDKDGNLTAISEDITCDMSDDITNIDKCKAYNPEDLSCIYYETNEERVNPLSRYRSFDCSNKNGRTPLFAQKGYIYGFHLPNRIDVYRKYANQDSSGMCVSFEEIYQDSKERNYAALSNSCAMSRGNGVYMKIGNNDFAYHVANRVVDQVVKEYTSGGDVYKFKLTRDGMRIPITLPFTLPTSLYTYTDEFTYYDKTTIKKDTIIPSSPRFKDIEFYGISGENDVYGKYNELTKPEKGKKIQFAISDLYYGDNEGTVNLVFTRGASYDGLYDSGILSWIWDIFVGRTFGIDIKTGEIVDDGIIIQLRNSILSSVIFQSFAYMLLVWSLTWTGFQFVTGKSGFDAKIMINRMMYIGFAVWAINPSSYELLDDILMPIFFKTSDWLSATIVNGLLSAVGVSSVNTINPANPFVSLDSLFLDLFGDVTFAKLLAMWREGGIFVFLPVLILIALVSLAMYIFRTSAIIMVSILCMGIYVTTLPLVMLGIFFGEGAKKMFDTTISKLTEKTIDSATVLIVFIIMLGFTFTMLKKLLGFEVCYKQVGSIGPLIKFFSWDMTSTPDVGEIVSSFALFMAIIYLSFNSVEFAGKISASIFGGGSSTEGSGLFNSFFDNTVGLASKAVGAVTKQVFGFDTTLSSKDLKDPSALIGRVASGAYSASNTAARLTYAGGALIVDKLLGDKKKPRSASGKGKSKDNSKINSEKALQKNQGFNEEISDIDTNSRNEILDTNLDIQNNDLVTDSSKESQSQIIKNTATQKANKKLADILTKGYLNDTKNKEVANQKTAEIMNLILDSDNSSDGHAIMSKHLSNKIKSHKNTKNALQSQINRAAFSSQAKRDALNQGMSYHSEQLSELDKAIQEISYPQDLNNEKRRSGEFMYETQAIGESVQKDFIQETQAIGQSMENVGNDDNAEHALEQIGENLESQKQKILQQKERLEKSLQDTQDIEAQEIIKLAIEQKENKIMNIGFKVNKLNND